MTAFAGVGQKWPLFFLEKGTKFWRNRDRTLIIFMKSYSLILGRRSNVQNASKLIIFFLHSKNCHLQNVFFKKVTMLGFLPN